MRSADAHRSAARVTQGLAPVGCVTHQREIRRGSVSRQGVDRECDARPDRADEQQRGQDHAHAFATVAYQPLIG